MLIKIGRYVRWGFWIAFNLVQILLPLAILHLLQFPSLLLLFFSKKLFRRYNRRLAAVVWGWWAFSMQHLLRLRVRFEGDVVAQDENAIVLCNHQAMTDILVLLCLAAGKGRIGDLKWLVKDAIKYVPGVGWGMLFMECVFLKRAWAEDEEKIINAFNKYKAEQIPLWMIMFPEGTRFKPSKLAASLEFTAQQGLPPLRHVLFPRMKGFYTAISGLNGYVKSIYSVTIAYADKAPKLYQLFRRDLINVRCHVRKIEAATLPSSLKELGAWLTEDFYLKDQLLAKGI